MKISAKELKQLIKEELGLVQEQAIDEAALDATWEAMDKDAWWRSLSAPQKSTVIAAAVSPQEKGPSSAGAPTV